MFANDKIQFDGPKKLYFSYSQVLVYDKNEMQPGSIWTDGHFLQGFVRRERSIGIGTLIDHGNADISVYSNINIDDSKYSRIVSVPITVDSGRICLEGPEEYPIDRSIKVVPGKYRVVAAQLLQDDSQLSIDFYISKLINGEDTSEIIKHESDLGDIVSILEVGEAAM